MQLLKWVPELELGLEQIDNQHKQLFNIINELNIAIEYNQTNSTILPIVIRLQQYANSHFQAEADIFTHYGYPGRVEHELEHAKFIDSIKYIRRQCEIIDTPMSSRVRDFLLDWLAHHIKSRDKEYKLFIDTTATK